MRDEFILIYSQSGSWGTRCLSPATVRPFAANGPRVWGHSRFSPAAFGPRAGHLSVQHFTLHQHGQGRQGLSFVAEGAAAHDSVRLHISVWGISPPASTGSTDGSKQRLQGFCSTAVAFLPPTERSDRGNTAVGHRTRVLQPKGDGGLRPILDLRRLIFPLQREVQDSDDKNHHVSGPGGGLVCHHRPEGCVFHIQVVQRHRRFLRFAFGGKAYQYKVLPFGLALAPRTFTKIMDAALAPLRLQGIRVLNYLDDWLILAHSRELVSRHRDIVLGHIHSLGLRMNAKKSVLLPSQRTVFLGVRLDSVQMQARLAPARIPVFTACLARFKLGHHVSVGTCRRLLGLMAAASPVLPLGLLHMRPFLWWMKELRLHPTVPATRLIRVSRSCCRHLLMWRDPVFLQSGVRMGAIHRRHMITTDASMTGWVAVFEERPASGEWKEEFLFWHINCLELRAVFLALKYFLPVLGGASYYSQDGQYGGCVPRHKPPRRFEVAHPGQACAASSPLVPRQVPLFEGGSRSGSTEPGSRFSVETEAQARGMDVEQSDGIPDLGSVWQSGGGPLCFSRVIPVPALVLPEFPHDSRHRCVRPPMAECQSVRVSANKADSGSTMQSEGERCPSPSYSPILALPDLVLGANSPLVSTSLGDSDQAGLTVPASGQDLASSAGALEVVGMAHTGPRAVIDGLPAEVQETIASARAPSTRKLYSSKWGVFESWCLTRAIDPVNCPVGPVLEFLQERLTAGAAATTLRVYVAAIAARRELDEIPLGRHRLVSAFMRGARRLRPVRPTAVPSWDLSVVLEGLVTAPFEPLESASDRILTLKVVLLLALTSLKRVGDLQAFSVSETCMDFAPGLVKVTLRPRPGYIPKVLSTSFRSQVVTLHSFHPPPFASSEDERLHMLCPVRALKLYVDRSKVWRRSPQLLICFGAGRRGLATSKQRISHWVRDAISLAYEARELPSPLSLRAHSTRGVASSQALFRGVPLEDICVAAGWSSPHTFVRFYNLDVDTAPGSQVLSVWTDPMSVWTDCMLLVHYRETR